MILNMQKLTLIGFLADKESILRDLMRKKCVQIEGAESIRDYDSISSITVPGVCQTYELEQELTKFNAAIRAVSPYEQKGGLFAKKERAEFSSMFDQSLFAESSCATKSTRSAARSTNRKALLHAHSCKSPRLNRGQGWIWTSVSPAPAPPL